jgi:hypothetical protein
MSFDIAIDIALNPNVAFQFLQRTNLGSVREFQDSQRRKAAKPANLT